MPYFRKKFAKYFRATQKFASTTIRKSLGPQLLLSINMRLRTAWMEDHRTIILVFVFDSRNRVDSRSGDSERFAKYSRAA